MIGATVLLIGATTATTSAADKLVVPVYKLPGTDKLVVPVYKLPGTDKLVVQSTNCPGSHDPKAGKPTTLSWTRFGTWSMWVAVLSIRLINNFALNGSLLREVDDQLDYKAPPRAFLA